MNRKKRIIICIIICIVLTPLIIWVGSLIKCEMLTSANYDKFCDAYKKNPMLGDMEYFKVLSCNDNNAKVYYVSKDYKGADVLTFEYNSEADLWEEVSWNTVWSSTGSASDVIYPYWWHFIYGGF